MVVLGIETSGRSGTIAVVSDQKVLGERELSATGRRHARTLVPEIGELLSDLNLTVQQIEVVGVSIGPGSFTGLRVGVGCAKTLAYALEIPAVAVDTFLALAERSGLQEQPLWVIDDALRGDVYAGHYRCAAESQWECVSPPRLMSFDELQKALQREATISGPGLSKFAEPLAGWTQVAPEYRVPHAREVALIAERRHLSGGSDNIWKLEPHYIRRSAAEEKAEQLEA